MVYDIAHLTFLNNPLTYQAGADEVCVHIPANVSSEEELITILRESLGFPEYCAISWWNTLEEVLRDWSDWSTTPRRVVILHSDLPLVRSGKNEWFSLQGYLQVLIRSITLLQEKNAAGIGPTGQRELVAIFPSQRSEELQTVLTHPPAWRITIGFQNYDVGSIFDPSWSSILQYLNNLDGLTAEICTLSREDLGYMTVHYQKGIQAYTVDYRSLDNEVWMMASTEEHPSVSPIVSFALAADILEIFFTSDQRSSSVHWSIIPLEDQFEMEVTRERSYYRSDEEARLELNGSMARSTMAEGVYEAVTNGEAAFSLEYWQGVLAQPNVLLSQRLTALCIIGFSALPEAPTLLRPFLYSQVKQERWVSARFCGMWGDEEALPVLLSMLTDELPLQKDEGEGVYDAWYDNWRVYAPQLLRKWQTPEIGEHLRQSLTLWVQAESSFDPEFDVWLGYEKAVCYELGYRGDLSTLAVLPLEGEHKKELLFQMEQGYKVKHKQMTDREEYLFLRYHTEPIR